MRLVSAMAILSLIVFNSCSQSEDSVVSSKYDLTPSKDSCKDFPVPIYPNVTSKVCEKSTQYENTPISYIAHVESKDSVTKVTKYYKTQMPISGWKVEPKQVESATHAVVTIRKGVAVATIVIDTGKKKKGSSFQIHAYPFGN